MLPCLFSTRPAGLVAGGVTVLMTILVLLIVLWLLGMVSSYTLGGFIHILLVLAVAVVLIRIIQGRRPI
jgi:asparagine N-glycosylation enzyme membrane subunit Stt3